MESMCNSVHLELCSGTLGERHRKLNQLVRDTPAEKLTLDVLRDMSTTNRIDLVYFGRLANHVKNGEIICELLKSDSSMVVSVALQSKWLFTGTTHQHLINVQYFDKEIFPQATLHTIHRVVSVLGACLRNERLAEDFYQYIREEFGKKLAFKLLPKCSLSFIRSKIMNNESEVPCAQMFSIYKKDSTLAIEYLENYLKIKKHGILAQKCSFENMYDKIWKQLAEEKPELFFELLEKHHDRILCKLGHRVADKILKKSGGKIVDNPEKYSKVFTDKYLVNALNEELLEKYLFNSLPQDKDYLRYYTSEFRFLKPEYRLQILMKLYPLKYKGEFFSDRDDFLDWELFKYLSKEEKTKWCQKNGQLLSSYDVEKRHDIFLCFLDQTEGVDKLITLYESASKQHERVMYLKVSVKCCSINNDHEALLQLLKYVATINSNDTAVTCKMFLENVNDSFTLCDLSAAHWRWIIEIIEFFCAENVIEKNCWQFFVVNIMKKHIHFCVLNNVNYVSSVEKIIKYNKYDTAMDFINEDITLPEHRTQIKRVFLDKYKDFFTSCYESVENENDKNEIDNRVHKILLDIVRSLKESKDTLVSEQSWVLEYICSNFKDWNNHQKTDIFSLVRTYSKAREMCPKEIFIYNTDHRILRNFVMFQPNVVTNNMPHFINSTVTLKTRRSVYYLFDKISTYMMNPIGDEMTKYLQQYIEEGSSSDDKNFMKYLVCNCYFMPPNERTEFIRRYAHQDQQEYKREQYIGAYLKTFDPPVDFDTLLSLFGVDYFKYSLTPIFAVCLKKPLNEVKAFVKSLIKHSVSGRKHSIRLSYFILPRRELLPLYKALWQTETNTSIIDVLFIFTYKLLVTEDDFEKYKEIWETFKYFTTRLDDKSKNILKFLTNPHVIIPEFVDEYCEMCWGKLNELSTRGVDVMAHKLKFMLNISTEMQWLSEEFCESIITEYLDSFESEYFLRTFVVDYLVFATSETQTKRIHFTLRIFKEFIRKNWNTKVDEKYKHRSVINDMVTRCCIESLTKKLEVSPINVLSSLSAMLTSSLPRAAVLHLHTMLTITICYVELTMDPRFIECDLKLEKVTPLECQLFENFGIKLNPILNEFCSQYGIANISLFKQSLGDVLFRLFLTTTAESLLLYVIWGILSHDATEPCYMFAIKSLPSSIPDDYGESIYDRILNYIVKHASLSMKVLLNESLELDSDCLKM